MADDIGDDILEGLGVIKGAEIIEDILEEL